MVMMAAMPTDSVLSFMPQRTPSAGPGKGKTWLGIYTVDAKNHAACLAPAGEARPKEFASPRGSGVINELWKKKGD